MRGCRGVAPLRGNPTPTCLQSPYSYPQDAALNTNTQYKLLYSMVFKFGLQGIFSKVGI